MLIAINVGSADFVNTVRSYLFSHIVKSKIAVEVELVHGHINSPTINEGLDNIFNDSLKNARDICDDTGADIGIGLAMGEVRVRKGSKEVVIDTIIICAVSEKHLITAVMPDTYAAEWQKKVAASLAELSAPHFPPTNDPTDPLTQDVGSLAAWVIGHIVGIEDQEDEKPLLN